MHSRSTRHREARPTISTSSFSNISSSECSPSHAQHVKLVRMVGALVGRPFVRSSFLYVRSSTGGANSTPAHHGGLERDRIMAAEQTDSNKTILLTGPITLYEVLGGKCETPCKRAGRREATSDRFERFGTMGPGRCSASDRLRKDRPGSRSIGTPGQHPRGLYRDRRAIRLVEMVAHNPGVGITVRTAADHVR